MMWCMQLEQMVKTIQLLVLINYDELITCPKTAIGQKGMERYVVKYSH